MMPAVVETKKRRHECGVPEWPKCSACDGRIHIPGCTSKRNPKVDCCLARHKRLYDAGTTNGIFDSSEVMWKEGMKPW